MNENEKYFLNSLLSVAPRCALLPSVVGAYNKGYTVRGSARPSPKFCSFVAKLRISLTLAEIFLFFFGLSPNCFKKFLNFFFVEKGFLLFPITSGIYEVLRRRSKIWVRGEPSPEPYIPCYTPRRPKGGERSGALAYFGGNLSFLYLKLLFFIK